MIAVDSRLGHSTPRAARLLAVRAGLRALPVRADLQPRRLGLGRVAQYRLVRIATLPDSFWDVGRAADVGYTLDDCLVRELTDPLWGAVRCFRSA